MEKSFLRIIRHTKQRLRLQRSFELSTSLGIIWVLAVTVLLYLLKIHIITAFQFLLLSGGGLCLLLLTALCSTFWRIRSLHAAKLIDTSHGLHDRLGAALEYSREKSPTDFMRAHIQDVARFIPDLSAKKAAPFRWPRDLRPLLLLLVCLGIVAALRFPSPAVQLTPPKTLTPFAVNAADLIPYRAWLHELEQDAAAQDLPEVQKLVQELNKLFEQIQRQELTRQELFAKLADLERKYLAGLPGNFDELLKKLKKIGDELQKDKLTKDIGKALRQQKLKQAQKELDKLSRELQQKTDQQRRSLARTLSRAARQKQGQDPLQNKMNQLKRDIRRLKKELQKKNNEQARRRLQKKERQLQRLNQQQQKQQQQRRQLQRLNQSLQQAASQLWNKLSPEAQKALQQAAQQMGRFAQQKSKLDLMNKAQGQLADLKEMLRRLGKGNKIRLGKLQDYMRRARGQKGNKKSGQGGKDGQQKGQGGKKTVLLLDGQGKSGSLVMPGSGQGQGLEQESPTGNPGNGIGSSTDPNLKGQASRLNSQRKDIFVRGQQSKGPTRSEVILGAAEKGFSSQSYRRVYQDYSQIIEEVLKQEEVPLGHKYYVKQYFKLIKPP